MLLIRGRGIVSMSRLILDYLWQRRQLLLFYLLTIGIFVIIQQLGGQEMAYAWYAVFLVTVILLFILIVDGHAYCKRRKLLRQIGERLDILKDLLPKSDGEPEATYQNFIISLCQELQTIRDNAAASRADSLHYYTVWAVSYTHLAVYKRQILRCLQPLYSCWYSSKRLRRVVFSL